MEEEPSDLGTSSKSCDQPAHRGCLFFSFRSPFCLWWYLYFSNIEWSLSDRYENMPSEGKNWNLNWKNVYFSLGYSHVWKTLENRLFQKKVLLDACSY